jgi:hypothetical protein
MVATHPCESGEGERAASPQALARLHLCDAEIVEFNGSTLRPFFGAPASFAFACLPHLGEQLARAPLGLRAWRHAREDVRKHCFAMGSIAGIVGRHR